MLSREGKERITFVGEQGESRLGKLLEVDREQTLPAVVEPMQYPDDSLMLATEQFSMIDDGYLIPAFDVRHTMPDQQVQGSLFIHGEKGAGKTKIFTPSFIHRSLWEKSGTIETPSFQISAPTIITSRSKLSSSNVFTATNKRQRINDFDSHDFELYKEAVSGLPNGFGESLRYIMDRVPITIRELAERVRMSDRQLGRYLTEPNLQPKLKTVVALCMGLQLFPRFSMHLIEKAGYMLRDNNESLAYQLLIHEFYADGIMFCNLFLEQMGVEPFFSPDKE